MVITFIVLLLAAAGWSGFWFYAASQTAAVADAWAAKEAQSGRVYNCASRSITGFPFSLEILCSGVNVALSAQAANQRPFTARLDSILIQARLSSPTSVTVDFDGPATVTDEVTRESFHVTWSRAQAVAGMPALAQRASILFDNLTIDRVDGSTRVPMARGAHVELRGAGARGDGGCLSASSRHRNGADIWCRARSRTCIRSGLSPSMPSFGRA